MQQADVVLYDRLVAPAILELCGRSSGRVRERVRVRCVLDLAQHERRP